MRKAMRWTAWALGAIVLLGMLAVLSVIIVGNTGAGRRLLEREIAKLTSGKVQIIGLSGRFPSVLNATTLQLRDSQGVWLSAHQVSVRWAPLALLRADLHVQRLDIAQLEVLRRPMSSPASANSRGSSNTHLPSLDLDGVAIDTLVLEPPAAGARALLTVRGSAHYRSLQDARATLMARRTNGNGSYQLALTLGHAHMNARLQLQEPSGGPLEHLVNLPGLGALSVEASIDGPRQAERMHLLARAGELHAAADGTLDLKRRAADLSYSLQAPAMSPGPGLAWRRVELQGHLNGAVAAPQATMMLDLDGISLPDGAQVGSVRGNASADGHVLSVHAVAAALMLPAGQPQLLQTGPLTLDATVRLDAAQRPLQLAIKHPLFELQAQGLTRGSLRGSFDLSLTDLTPIAALYHQPLRGSLTLSGKVSQSGDLVRAEVSGHGNLRGASPAAQLLGRSAQLHVSATLQGSSLNLQQLALSGHALSVSAAGSVQRGAPGAQGAARIRALNAHWQVSLPDLALLSPTLSGSLQMTGMAEGTPQSLAANLQLRSSLSLRGGPAGRFVATLQARGLPSAPSASVRATGRLDGAPLHLDAAVNRVGDALYHVVIDHTAWKSLSADGDLTAGANLAAGHGHLQLRIDRLADLQTLIGMPLAGSVAANVNLVAAAGRPRAMLELSARHLRVHGVAAQAQLSAAGPINALRIQLQASSPSIGGAPADIAASAQLDDSARVLALKQLQLHYHAQTVRLLSQPRVSFAKGLAVRNLRLGAGHALIVLDGRLSPTLAFNASIHRLDAALVNAFAPGLLASGTLDADAQLRGSRAAPVGRASLHIAGLRLANADVQGVPALNVIGSARLDGTNAAVDARLDAGSVSSLKLTGRVPLNLAGAFATQVSGRLDLALLNPILAEQGEHVAGKLTVTASVNGTARAPQIAGSVQLSNGDLRDYGEGIHLGSINAKLVGSQGSLRIASMTARAGPGRLTMTGTVGLLQPGMPLDIAIKGQRIQPITNDILTANLNADMHVGGTLRQRLAVSGNVHINRAAVNIPNGFPPSVATLDVVVPGQKAPKSAKTPLVIALALVLDAPQTIFVHGRGLDAQLGGQLQVSGTSDHPQVAGAFTMDRGTYSLADTTIKFTSGRVSFNGEGLSGKIDPTLDFVAEASVTYNGTPTVVNLTVTGLADAPKVALSSSPPLPQDDLLALLLFGQPASQLTALQLAETGAALASLSGIGGGGGGGGHSLNPLTWIKHALGLNAFSVGGATPPAGTAAGGGSTISGASVSAGKYISNRVYVAATQSTTGTSQVQVDVDLNGGFKLQTRLGNGTATAQGTTPQNDPGSSIGLTWQHRY